MITPLSFGGGDGGGASCCWERGQLLLERGPPVVGEGASCCWGGTSIFSGLVYFQAKYLTSHFLPYFNGVMGACKG